jgi:hypothetical protein
MCLYLVDSSIIRVAVLSNFQFSATKFFRNSFSVASAYHDLGTIVQVTIFSVPKLARIATAS